MVRFDQPRRATTSLYIAMAIMASIWYLALTSVLMVGQYYIERYYAKGAMRDLPPTPIQKLRARLGRGGDA